MSVAAQKINEDFDAQQSYDSVPYESFSYPQTHPRHMYTIGKLFGLKPTEFKKARVLEIGCASGVNIFSQALQYPNAQYLGIDISPQQIEMANKTKATLKTKNVEFLQKDILDFDVVKNKGSFDYIMCHGIFSWVPSAVQERILEICDKCLTENGLAVISYNTLPGWNAVRSLREMMLFHIEKFKTPQEKVSQARALLEFLKEAVPEQRKGYRSIIEEELGLLKGTNDSYLFHDHLEGTNAQFYFHEFAQRAGKHGLIYVGDSSLTSMFVGNLPKAAADKLKALTDVVQQEQYMDFITNRRFRTSIFGKKGISISRNINAAQIMDFYLSPNMAAEQEAKLGDENIKFATGTGQSFTAGNKVVGAIYLTLMAQGRRAISAKDLVKKTHDAFPEASKETIESTLKESAIQLVLYGYVNLHSDTPEFVDQISKKPEAFALARLEAEKPNCRVVTNVLHGAVTTDAVAAMMITLLDGTRTVDKVIDDMAAMAKTGKLTAKDGQGNIVTDAKAVRAQVADAVNKILPLLAREAILVA